MNVNDAVTLILSGAVGAFLGVVFFGGLWWTVRKAIASPRPDLWFFGSLNVRMSIVLLGFYFVSGGQWERIFACLFGFMIARIAVTRLTKDLAMAPAIAPHPDNR